MLKRLNELWEYIVNRITTRHHIIQTGLPKGALFDVDDRMLHGMMNLLMQYIDEEKPFERLDWDSDKETRMLKEEIIAIRDWWQIYDLRQEEINKALSNWYKNKKPNGEAIPDTPFIRRLSNKHNDLEEKLSSEEEEMLIRLIKIRKMLWT